MENTKKIKILKEGLFQRTKLLEGIEEQIRQLEESSDMGWMLTLGNQDFGMLLAVDAAQNARKLKLIANNLQKEISVIREAISSIS